MDGKHINLLQPWNSDMNLDGQFTPVDLGIWVQHVFFVPGDYMLSTLIAPWLGLGNSPASALEAPGGTAAALSIIFWLCAAISLVVVCRLVREACATAVEIIRAAGRAVLRQWHRIRIRTRIASHHYRLRSRRRQSSIAVPEDIELDALDIAVIRTGRELEDGYVMTAHEIADALRVLPSEAQSALEKLQRLEFVARGFGTDDGDDGYRLTQSGELYLMACQPDLAGMNSAP